MIVTRSSGGVVDVAGEGESRGRGQQVGGQRGDRNPDPVLCHVVVGQVT